MTQFLRLTVSAMAIVGCCVVSIYLGDQWRPLSVWFGIVALGFAVSAAFHAMEDL